LRDTRDYYHNDFQFFIIATILLVLLIMIVLLRAIVAPLYLIASVLVSYFSALGLGVLVFQVGLGQELHWSVPGLTFILLVAVGADYNLLLISRIRDESPHGIRIGVIRTVASTGGVITSAGLIFAASMLGLMFASITTMVQAGFVIGVGILLDTFLVRTVTVPAIAVLVGRANWWPNRWLPESWSAARRAKRAKKLQRRNEAAAIKDIEDIAHIEETPTDASELVPEEPETIVVAAQNGNGHVYSHSEPDSGPIPTKRFPSRTATAVLYDIADPTGCTELLADVELLPQLEVRR